MNYVAYYRVSTERQGKSGLGLAAQKRKIDEFLSTTDNLMGEFCDIQSGRDNSRVNCKRRFLWRSFTTPRSLSHAWIGFRDASVSSPTFWSGIGLCCAEMPHASDFQLHIFAALAQEERRLISERTRAALAEAKRRGKILGANGRNLAAKNRKAADEFAATLRAKLDAGLMQRSYSEIARHLNDAGVMTATGRKFYPQTVKNYVKRSDCGL